MNIQDLQQLYARHPQVRALSKALAGERVMNITLEGLTGSAAAMVFAGLATLNGQPAAAKGATALPPLLFIMQDNDEAGYLYHDLCQLMGDDCVLFFPSSYRRAIKYAQKDPASEILRTEVLTALRKEPTACSLYIVTFPEALAEMVVTRRRLDEHCLTLTQGETRNVDSLCDELRQMGFREVDYVYEPGQFALRGSILDVFSFSHEHPFRIDFFGDEIDSVRTFEVETQLSDERREQADIVPEMASETQRESLLSFLPDDTVLIYKNKRYAREAIERIYQEGFSTQAMTERMEVATEMERHELEKEMRRESLIVTGQQFATEAERFRTIELRTGHSTEALPASTEDPQSSIEAPHATVEPRERGRKVIGFNTSAQPLFHKNFDLLTKTLEDYQLKGYQLYVLADSQKQNERLKEILSPPPAPPLGRGARLDKMSASLTKHPSLGEGQGVGFTPVDCTLHEGFIDHDLHGCLFTDHQIFDRFHKYNLKSDKARSGKVALTLKEIQQFELGDYVVHVDHGIGRFGGLVRMPINQGGGAGGGFQEMIKITYQRGDAIYVSIHSLYKVSKYKSQDGGQPPRVSTLGTGQWERLKERTKKHIKDIARDLIKLYAARRRQKGFAFSHDTYLQHELEASFLYEDTPDQLKATQDVKADMEQARPMDRLVCGDVGFGKTEVAVRAAFKAAVDGKQVAVMVPTTVLAYQHFRTFSSRLKDMPVRVDYLTRARTTKQTTQLLKDLEEGKIDILIGTHKLIGKTVKFKDLGLLIIDEEQKFGVSTKEKLRQMKTNVDTLTMSATPIPRTLQFSLMGARDLSVIQTPPPNRYPIQTEIHTFSPEIIADAVNFEMSRNGQVYFVNNRISDLTSLRDMIKKYVPDARVAIGHGQMKPEELEKIVLDFSNYDYDVLLSTTIVENGIDIPNANTIIINGAHNFGLSDLHQMRGRVGRGNRKAFCYLLAPPLAALPQDSRRRLEALENFSDLGSGINIAMQDLDIRGAGNLLGAEQSGFISDLGYETYQKILNEAMVELRNEEPAPNLKSIPNPSRGEGSLDSSVNNKKLDGSANDKKPDSSVNNKKKSSSANGKGNSSPLPWGGAGGGHYVTDCTLESDLEMYFPDQYVPSDSERMLLYRELDSIGNRDNLTAATKQIDAYRSRLIDRFGPLPSVAEELLQVVPLRILGKQLGCEQIMLKQGRMFLFFVSAPNSPFYQSDAFGSILNFVGQNVGRCTFRDQNGKRSLVIAQIPSVQEAVGLLKTITTAE